ncbi:PREDICTED: protein NRT1/ PTR FAMILY 4.7 isoform X2 [Tarenaya hassleriana]|uniref:protein NRT1/ PTR FAMILY 4.7 isoform X2 n=1 Tax=Tarenaya hassleriana TaxID=28532 RepID=UPI00053CA7CF|nr:PREDICTED: protein NRT1/ PTR FAMILY 4.7 isoform X2 [Tarenaya hassleriana]
MEIESSSINSWDGYRDWRSRPALPGRHGGMLAASFVLVVEVLENLAFLASASNLVLYLTKEMEFSPSGAANSVTVFMGTAFFLALLGGFLADAFFTTFHIYLFSATIEFLGLVVLTGQACAHSARPWARGVLFGGLYLVALGVGGIKGSLPPHGAEQFDESTPRGRKQRSYFFNYFVFSLSCGALVAVTFVVWLEDNVGWQWGFGVSTLSILLSVPVFLSGSTFYRLKVPSGSPITTLFKVLTAALYAKYCGSKNSRNAVMAMETGSSSRETDDSEETKPISDLGFVEEALTDQRSLPRALQCTTQQVQDVRIVLKILPIFMSTIMLNCCLAQLSTFSVQQASTMNTKLGKLTVPPAALPVFPVVFTMILAPVYNHLLIPLARKATRTEMGITHLQRIGTGLVLSVVAMSVAALVETKRKRIAVSCGPSNSPLPITFLWLAFQYVFLGSADLFTLAGMMEFFFTEAPSRMRSLATSLSWTSLAMGYYLSSLLVSAVNFITGSFGHSPWLSGDHLNQYHLERFYWLMCVLTGLNFVNYLFWACRYTYRASQN